MRSNEYSPPGLEAVARVFDAFDAEVAALDPAGHDPAALLWLIQRIEKTRRLLLAGSGSAVNALAGRDPAETGGPVRKVVADVCRVSPAESRRRIKAAAQLCPRKTLTGESLPPKLPATAEGWRDGLLDPEHVHVIAKFVRELPKDIPADVVEESERILAGHARELRPDQLATAADRLAELINPDGTFSDADRARQRGFTWSAQRRDGMSTGTLNATPELRSYLDAWFAKFGAPGMCNPDDEQPCVESEPSEAGVQRDTRSPRQRNHDALVALVRGQLGDPVLGKHRGLPVTVIATATLDQLRTGAGYAVTGGATLLPIPVLIRMARHAYHYLAVFDAHDQRPLYLGRTKRIASADQRIVLYGKEHGCTKPGCDAPGYWSEVHHTTPWSEGGHTDITDLTLACPPDHASTQYGWRTVKRKNGDTEWIPPPQFGLAGGINTFHHPDRLLAPPDEPTEDDTGPPGAGDGAA